MLQKQVFPTKIRSQGRDNRRPRLNVVFLKSYNVHITSVSQIILQRWSGSTQENAIKT